MVDLLLEIGHALHPAARVGGRGSRRGARRRHVLLLVSGRHERRVQRVEGGLERGDGTERRLLEQLASHQLLAHELRALALDEREHVLAAALEVGMREADLLGLAAVGRHLVELVHVEEARERVEVSVAEELGADLARESIGRLDDDLRPVLGPADDLAVAHGEQRVDRADEARHFVDRDEASPPLEGQRRVAQHLGRLLHALVRALLPGLARVLRLVRVVFAARRRPLQRRGSRGAARLLLERGHRREKVRLGYDAVRRLGKRRRREAHREELRSHGSHRPTRRLRVGGQTHRRHARMVEDVGEGRQGCHGRGDDGH
mmetsp:Transcript_18345/g.57729  ORF Transcript_18345/g.57729 Transcript_18345/m.57729 type:complete len:318 (-) Transcript_18345:268-1221(-)